MSSTSVGASGQAVSATPGILFKMQIWGSHLRPTESETSVSTSLPGDSGAVQSKQRLIYLTKKEAHSFLK